VYRSTQETDADGATFTRWPVKADDAVVSATLRSVIDAILALAPAVSEPDQRPYLEALIAFAESLDPNAYTPNTWTPLALALSVAILVRDNPASTPGEIESVLTALIDAMQSLIARANKTGLASAIQLGDSILANSEAYVPASLVALIAELPKARAVYDDGNATQAQVSTAQSALVVALAAVRVRPVTDKSLLGSRIKQAEQILSSPSVGNYEYTTVQALRDALAAAKLVMDNLDATQTQIDTQTTLLTNAINGLHE